MAVFRERVVFVGRVQGVFFRATSAEIAKMHPVSGYVKNLADGSVEMQVQGTEESIDAFLTAVKDCYAGNVQSCERRRISTIDEPVEFQILR